MKEYSNDGGNTWEGPFSENEIECLISAGVISSQTIFREYGASMRTAPMMEPAGIPVCVPQSQNWRNSAMPPSPQQSVPFTHAAMPSAPPAISQAMIAPPPPPAPAPEQQYFVCMPDGSRSGPIGARMLQSGAYHPETMVWTAGMANWQPLRSVIGACPYRKPFLLRCMSFSGRATRKEFWLMFLVAFIIFVILRMIGYMLINNSVGFNWDGNQYIQNEGKYYTGIAIAIFATVFFIGALLPSTVRRLHDIEKNAAFSALILGSITVFGNLGDAISLVGCVCFLSWIVLMCFDSKRGTNKFGPSEKYPL